MFVTRSDVTKGEANLLRRAKLMVESGLNWKSSVNVGHKTASLILTPVESKTVDEETIDLSAITGKAFYHGTESFLFHEKKYRWFVGKKNCALFLTWLVRFKDH